MRMRTVIASALWIVAALGVAAPGCKLKENRGAEPSAADEGVVRYSGQEVAVTGSVVLTASVTARKAADTGAAPVQTLPAGTGVTRKAEFQSFTLVSFTGANGVEASGWIQTDVVVASNANPAVATGTARPVIVLPKPTTTTTTTATPPQKCTGGKVWDGTACSCPSNTAWNGSSCVAAAQTCTGGKVWNGSACACPASTSWDGANCKPVIKLHPPG